MRTREELLALAEEGVKLALQLGADDAEIYLVASEVSKVTASGRLLSPSSSDETSLGVRVIRGGRAGVSGAASAGGARNAIQEALRSIEGVTPGADAAQLPPPVADTTARATLPPLEDAEMQTDVLQAVVDAALSDARITFVEAKAVAAHRRIAIASSRGVRAFDETMAHRLELEVRATRGTTHRSGRQGTFSTAPLSATIDPAARVAAIVDSLGRALDGGAHLDAPVTEAIFAPPAIGQLLGIATGAFVARRDAARPIGSILYGDAITLVDQPHGPDGVRRRHVDDEGTPTGARTLVERGTLVAHVHDHQSALRAGVSSTGHGMRAAASSNVSPRPINLAVAAGDATLTELIEQAERAVLVTEPLLGGFTSNLGTGDFSVVVPYAFLVENGRLRGALGPTTVGGNAHRVLASAKAVGRERVATSSCFTPEILAGGVSCAT